MADKLLFSEFLLTDRGQGFVEALEEGPDKNKSAFLEDALGNLLDELVSLSEESCKPTYEPVLDGIARVTKAAGLTMLKHGVAQRNLKDTKKHSVKDKDISPRDVLRAIEAERQYHATMFKNKRETVQEKSPSEMAFTMTGLISQAHKAAANDDTAGALKLLKDATSVGIRTLHESQQPDSIAKQALAHKQGKRIRKQRHSLQPM